MAANAELASVSRAPPVVSTSASFRLSQSFVQIAHHPTPPIVKPTPGSYLLAGGYPTGASRFGPLILSRKPTCTGLTDSITRATSAASSREMALSQYTTNEGCPGAGSSPFLDHATLPPSSIRRGRSGKLSLRASSTPEWVPRRRPSSAVRRTSLRSCEAGWASLCSRPSHL